jgi:hypothetical protein
MADVNRAHFNVLLIGETGVGKSSTVNYVAGREAVEARGGFVSTTKDVQSVDAVIGEFSVSIIDTPGLFDTSGNLSNPAFQFGGKRQENHERRMLKSWLGKALEKAGGQIHAIALVINLNERAAMTTNAVVHMVQEIIDVKLVFVILTHGNVLFGDRAHPSSSSRAGERYREVESQYSNMQIISACVLNFMRSVNDRVAILDIQEPGERLEFNDHFLKLVKTIASNSQPYCNEALGEMKERLRVRERQHRDNERAKRREQQNRLDQLETQITQLVNEDDIEAKYQTSESKLNLLETLKTELNSLSTFQRCEQNLNIIIKKGKEDEATLTTSTDDLGSENKRIKREDDQIAGNIKNHSTKLKDLYIVLCQDVLKAKIVSYVQSARELVQHRDTGMETFEKAADDLEKAFAISSGLKIFGGGLSITGGILGVIGGGLLLGGVTAPAGIAVLATGAAIGITGGVTGASGTIGDIIKNRKELKMANSWMKDGAALCKSLMDRHDEFHRELDDIYETFHEAEVDIVRLAMGNNENGGDIAFFDVEAFQDADERTALNISEWRKALELGGQAVATAVLTGSRVTGAVARGAATGVEVGTETGAAVARTLVQAAGGVAVGLSAVFIAVDLALLGKVAYDLKKKKERGGTELSKQLRDAAHEFEMETEDLKPLADIQL